MMSILRLLTCSLLVVGLTTACEGNDPYHDDGTMLPPKPGTEPLPAGAGKPADPNAPKGEGGAKGTGPFECGAGSRPGATGDSELKLAGADGKERLVMLHVPGSYAPTKGVPLVLSFHGYGGNADQMRAQTGFDAEADKRGFIVAYVQGTGLAQKGFNAGDCCGAPAWTSDTDDIGLAREIVKKLATDYCVDPKRVHNAGFSNGGFMSYRLVCEAADLFASVASVSGVLGVPPEECKPARPVPLIHIHGTNDKTVSYEGGGAAGGLGSLVGIKFRSVADSVGNFKTAFACGEGPKEIAKEVEDTKCEEWSGCQGGAKLELCTVEAGGHQWPGGKPTPVGGKTSTFGATKAILDFFDAHPFVGK
jgi:polyhydroxybutyrate depolymerase